MGMQQFPGCRFAGIDDVARLGLGVAENAGRLHRLAYLERRCLLVMAAHLPTVPEWEIKLLLGRHLYEDAEHHQSLRTRIAELRRSESSVDRCPDPDLARLMDALLQADTSIALLGGLYGVIKPALAAAFAQHLEAINPLVDYPTGRVLRQLLAEEQAQITLGQRYLDALMTDDEDRTARSNWEQHLSALLAAAGGISGEAPRTPAADHSPRDEQRRASAEAGRDSRFTTSLLKDPCVAVPARSSREQEALEEMMWVRYQEMSPAEAVAIILSQQTEMPWAFYRDLARHCWDELRHSAFGQAALEAEGIAVTTNPSWVGFTAMVEATMSPIEAYAHLTVAIEQAAMRYPPGKRQEYEFCRDTLKHPLMALYQDYDWADEVTHAQFGRTWIVQHLCGNDRRAAVALGEETMRRRAAFFAQQSADGHVKDALSRRALDDRGAHAGSAEGY